MKRIPLMGRRGSGLFSIVDDSDFSLVSGYRWYLSTDGYALSTKYLGGGRKNQKQRRTYMHRLVMGFPKSNVDHKSGDKLDNRKSNLRLCNQSQNAANMIKRGLRGVRFKDNGWESKVRCMGKYYTKFFKDKDEAIKWRNDKARELFGEFARETS